MAAQKKSFLNPKVLGIVLVVLVLLGVGAYFLSPKIGVSLPLVGAPLNPNCEHNDPDLCKFLNNWVNVKDFTVTSTSNEGGMTMESKMEISGDKFHMVSVNNGNEEYNMISIGDTTYTKDYSDGKWWKMTSKPVEGEAPESDIKDELEFSAEDNTTYKLVGKEACGDKMCFKYEVIYTDGMGGQEFILFDDHEYKLRKTISVVDGGEIVAEYSYGGVSISEPSPTKDMGEGDMMQGGASGYSEEDVKKMMEQYGGSEGSTDPGSYEMPADDSMYQDYISE